MGVAFEKVNNVLTFKITVTYEIVCYAFYNFSGLNILHFDIFAYSAYMFLCEINEICKIMIMVYLSLF